MSWGDAFARFFGLKQIREVPIDPASVRDNHQIKALAHENTKLKTEKAKLEKDLALQRRRKEDIDEEENIKESLHEQKKDLDSKKKGKFFSMKRFWTKYLKDQKFRNKLNYYSFDRKEKLAPFGDIGFMDNGDIVLLDDNGNMLIKMPKTKDIFQSVGALGHDMDAGKVVLNMDNEGGYIENIMADEIPEILQTGSQLVYSKARKRPVYQIIQQMNDQISELYGDLQEAELTNKELNNKIVELNTRVAVSEEISENALAETQSIEDSSIGIHRHFRNLQSDLNKSRLINEMNQDEIDKYRILAESLRSEAERQGVKLSDDKAFEIISRVRSQIVNEEPERAKNNVQEEK